MIIVVVQKTIAAAAAIQPTVSLVTTAEALAEAVVSVDGGSGS